MITIDTLNEIFSEVQSDVQQIIGAVNQEFQKPETDREAVKLWLDLPLVLREVITTKNPQLASSLNKKTRDLQGGK